MIPEKDYPMYEAMKKYGGGFVQGLADLLQVADHENYAKLEKTFKEYFDRYRDIAIKSKLF
ncbi:MAG: hypothetical protein WC788_08185 [Candidatus Paceibacterota bacterium]|jgi:hypothetical protein